MPRKEVAEILDGSAVLNNEETVSILPFGACDYGRALSLPPI